MVPRAKKQRVERLESVVRWSVCGAAEKMGFGVAGVPCRRCWVGYAVSAPLAPPKRL